MMRLWKRLLLVKLAMISISKPRIEKVIMFALFSYWLGGTAMITGNWTWTDYSAFSYKNWGKGKFFSGPVS